MKMEAAGILWVILAGVLLPARSFGSTVTTDKAGEKDLNAQAFYPTENPQSNYSKVSCDFSSSMCGWENVGGENYTLSWTRRWSYAHLHMENDLKGRLASPWLDPWKNYTCQLIFRYYIRYKSKNCQLSLIMETSTGPEQTVWFTQKSTGLWSFSGPMKTEINCSVERYRLVFEAWKSCDIRFYNEIDISSIRFLVFPENKKPVTTEASATMETFTIRKLITVESTTPGSISSSPNGQGTKDPGAKNSDDTKSKTALTVIIVSSVVVVIAVVVVIIIIVKCCRRGGQREKKPSHCDGSGNVNSALVLEVEDDTYNHTSTSAPRPANADDTYDHTSTSAPRPANADDTYDHTNSGSADSAKCDDYENTSQQLHSPAMNVPTTSSGGAAAIFVQAETTDYECVDGEDFVLKLPDGEDNDM